MAEELINDIYKDLLFLFFECFFSFARCPSNVMSEQGENKEDMVLVLFLLLGEIFYWHCKYFHSRTIRLLLFEGRKGKLVPLLYCIAGSLSGLECKTNKRDENASPLHSRPHLISHVIYQYYYYFCRRIEMGVKGGWV